MDPNMIRPSRPSSIYSPSCSDSAAFRTTASPTARKLPLREFREIFAYAAETLKAISFDILQKRDPQFLKDHGLERPVDLHWHATCKKLLDYTFPERVITSLSTWLPEISYAVIDKNIMTALAACKTIDEAAHFASAMGFKEEGRKLTNIASEMDCCRLQMGASEHVLNNETGKAFNNISYDRLKKVLRACKENKEWELEGSAGISQEVLDYTYDEKIEEHPMRLPSNGHSSQ